MRIGHGFDVHAFAPENEGKPLILGGVTIPYPQGLIAHSDGDVVIHALCDAMLGAVGLWDIGHHFPDTDDEYKDIDSRILLRRIVDEVKARYWKTSNIDITVVAQAPKLADYIPEIRTLLAADLKIEETQVNIKATTTEGLGAIGRKEGIAAHAVVLLAPR